MHGHFEYGQPPDCQPVHSRSAGAEFIAVWMHAFLLCEKTPKMARLGD